MSLTRVLLLSLACLAIIHSPAQFAAAHDDISPGVTNSRITTGGYEDATSQYTPGVRVFGFDFQEDLDEPFFAGDPGFNAVPNSGLTAGSQLRFNILAGKRFGLPANLTYWDGSGPVDFGLVPSGESLRLNRGGSNLLITGTPNDPNPLTNNDQLGYSIGTVLSAPPLAFQSLHQHLFSFLNGGDGNSIPAGPGEWGTGDGVQPVDGIYLFALELTSSDTNLQNSLPLFILFNNGLSEDAHDEAIAWVEANLTQVPEPSSVILVAMGGIGLAVIVCRRKKRQRTAA